MASRGVVSSGLHASFVASKFGAPFVVRRYAEFLARFTRLSAEEHDREAREAATRYAKVGARTAAREAAVLAKYGEWTEASNVCCF